jgi:D-beta-D-heptose 7-phosphate kinase/D-beta-D-heptose 1-phosphate adenosyltransferase
MRPVVFVSGGFDFPHNGHVQYVQEAAKLGHVVVLLNSDEWLIRKKGYKVLDWDARREILKEMRSVFAVYEVDDSDGTVCAGIQDTVTKLGHIGNRFIFAKGGDRTAENTPEQEICAKLGVTCVFGVGGEKIASSSDLVRAVTKKEPVPCMYEDAT